MSALSFWLPFGGYLLVGFVATFGFEMTTQSNKGRRRYFLLFAVATALNMFLFPLVSDKVTGNSLSLEQSDAMTEAGNFLGPLEQVFQFLEDGTTVRIAAAVGAEKYQEAGDLIKIAIYAGLGSGAVAGAFIIPLAFIGPLFAFFVPYSTSSALPAGCTQTGPVESGLTDIARPYWILSACALPFVFATKCSLAFFLGSRSFVAWVVAGIIASGIGLALTFVFVVNMNMGVVGVGIVGLISAPLFVGVCIGFLSTKSMREKYKFTSFRLSPGSSVILARSAKDGFKLMLKDLLGSVAGHLPSMFAAQLSVGLQYALTLIGEVSGKLNVFSAFLALSGRLRGARMLGGGMNKDFRHLAKKLIIQGTVCGLAGTIAALSGIQALPAGFASHSISKLHDDPCTKPLYDQVFDASTGPAYWMMAFSLYFSTMNTVYGSLLYSFRDFSLLLKVGALNFVVGMPLQILAFVSIRNLTAIYAASVLPTFITYIVYVWRFHWVLLRQLPTENTPNEVVILPEHGASREGVDSLLSMAEEDIDSMLLGRRRTQSSSTAVGRPPKMGGLRSRPVSAPYKLDPVRPGGIGVGLGGRRPGRGAGGGDGATAGLLEDEDEAKL